MRKGADKSDSPIKIMKTNILCRSVSYSFFIYFIIAEFVVKQFIYFFRLTSEGFLKPCLQYGNGTDVREMLRNGADDSLIEEKMREAVFFKPDGHEFGRSGKGEEIETKKMSQIGG